MTSTKTYRVTVRGRLTEPFVAALPGLLVDAGNGHTTLVGRVDDQAGLYGLLNRLRDLNVELVRLEEVDE